jgi:hypothetical protein
LNNVFGSEKRNMFYESAVRQAKEVARLQKQIKGLLTDVVTTEDM